MSIESYPSPNGVLTSLIWRKTAAGSETSLSGYDNASQALSYTPGQEQVYLNGILLVRGSDYTATNGTSITGLSALAADDFVQINCYNNFLNILSYIFYDINNIFKEIICLLLMYHFGDIYNNLFV